MFLAQSGATVTLKDLDTLNIMDSGREKELDGLSAWGGANITADNIGDVNIGSAEKHFNAGGCAIHGASGHITLSNVDNVNIYTDGTGIMAQNNTNANDTDPSVKINATGNVIIDANKVGLQASSINSNPGSAMAEVTADGKITITSRSNVAVYSADFVTPYEGGGTTAISIKGKEEVSISGANAINISRSKEAKEGAASSFTVESENGDVNLSSTSTAVYMDADGTENDTLTNAAGITGTITGNNVTISNSQKGALLGVDTNSSLNIAVNKDQGIIKLNSVTGTAANLNNGGVLTLGDGKTQTEIQTNGGFAVNGTNSKVTIAKNTTTIVNAAAIGKSALVTATNGGTFTVAEGAKLKVNGVSTGVSLYSTDTGTNSKVSFWTDANTSFDNAFQYLDENGTVRAGVTESNAASLAGFIVLPVGIAATNANDSGITTLAKNGASSYNEAVGIAQAGGVQHGTYAVTGLVADALANHEDTAEKDVWAKGFHSTEDIDGLGFEGGALDLDTQYNGAVAGIDLYQKDSTAAGVAFSYADGNVSGVNGGVYTKNDAEYLGISFYGKKDFGAYRLAADLSYLGGSHDLTQHNDGTTVTAKPDTEAWTLGVKALKDYDLGSGTLTPYAGVRYLRLTTDSYTSSLGLSYDSETQNLFLLPVGADYSLNLKRGGWTVAPYVGLGYIWTVGDRSADQTVSYGTTAGSYAYDVTDAGSFLAKAGISASKGAYAFFLGYAYQKGSTVDSDTWTAAASYRF